ncbi:MAG: TonB-dependent receptor [Gammaproteobacteria bacterium]|nr:TonB-dependent receptor [Gammaproteobacteria bacterium]
MKRNKFRWIERSFFPTVLSVLLIVGAGNAIGQEEEEEENTDEEIEEVVVTGTQIKGADIGGILPVTVFEAEDVEAFGVSSGDELLDLLPEQGQNFFNEEETISGGVNAARGDIGAFNLRNLGTGNTLVLLNGRRLVNAASYQTEEVGGSFVPVNTVNSNTIPVFGVDRVEILRDGAAAVYGADAVAGVVNTVLRSDYEGVVFRWRVYTYDLVGRVSNDLTGEWGRYFNDGKTHIGLTFNYYTRDAIHASEDSKWANSEMRYLVPDDSPWSGSTSFRNTSANSLWGQYDIRRSVSRFGLSGITDRSGEFETFPLGHEDCDWVLNETTCGAVDGNGTYRYNLNEFRDLSSALSRFSTFLFMNHELDNGIDSFTEVLFYSSQSELWRHPSAPFSSVKLRVGPENYYNPFGPCGSPNRLPEDLIPDVPCEGLELEIDNYRFAQVPRIVLNDGNVFRFLQGFRGTRGEWDWEAAGVWSVATREDLTRNRVSNSLAAEALFDPTPAAYNPFSGGMNSNIERILVDVSRDNMMSLFMVDLKVSNQSFMDLPAGPVSALLGTEIRTESFDDDRDPRLDGTIVFTDYQGDTYPFVSDVVNSSPTPDSSGDRLVFSLFGELHVPLVPRLDSLIALRYENFSDIGDTFVGRVAVGFRPVAALQLRGAWSQAFRAPNLITVNEDIVARQNTRTDWACTYAALNGGDPEQDVIDCVNSTQRVAQGSEDLVSEESVNVTFGVVVEPSPWLTFTVDYWSIEKENTIGLFGEENHTVYDLLLRIRNGLNNCESFTGNPAVNRLEDIEDDEAAIYTAAGICPAGLIHNIVDNYANLDTRSLSGIDFGIYLDFETDFGSFSFKYLRAQTDEFSQEPGGPSLELVNAKEAGIIPADIPVAGFADLIGQDGNQEYESTFLLRWRNFPYAATLFGNQLGEFYQDSLTIDDGTPEGIRYVIPEFMTWNVSFDYTRDFFGERTRFRFGIKNVTGERAPLADRYFGFFSDAHRDYGRYYYFDIRFRKS